MSTTISCFWAPVVIAIMGWRVLFVSSVPFWDHIVVEWVGRCRNCYIWSGCTVTGQFIIYLLDNWHAILSTFPRALQLSRREHLLGFLVFTLLRVVHYMHYFVLCSTCTHFVQFFFWTMPYMLHLLKLGRVLLCSTPTLSMLFSIYTNITILKDTSVIAVCQLQYYQ